MAPSSLCICLVGVLAHIVFLAQGQTVTCRYADSILVSGTCFRYNSTGVTWAAGKAFCASMNGALAMVNSSAQITTALKNLGYYGDAWIGANDIDVKGTFIWDHDKSPAASSLTGLWAIGQPGVSDCCEVYRTLISYKVYASDCSSLYGTLCMEMPLPTTTSTTATPTTSPTTTSSTTTTTTPTTTTTTPTTTTTTPTTTTTTPTTTTTTPTTPTTTPTATTTTPTTTTTTPTATTTTPTATTTTPTATTTTPTTTTTTQTTTTTASTPGSTTLTPSMTTTTDASTVEPTQSTVKATLSTDATSAITEPTTPESTTTTREETSPPTTIALETFMRGGVEPVKLNAVFYALPALIILFFKQDGRLHLS